MGEPLRGAVVVVAPPPALPEPDHMTPRLLEVLDKCDCADGMSAKDLEVALGIAMQTAFEYLNDLHRTWRSVTARSLRPCGPWGQLGPS